jgi:hypothetical protein
MNNKLTAAVMTALLFMGGCATQTVTAAGYYWGDYSKTLYQYTKAPSDETLAAHAAELERIIEESGKRDLRVPPGIHAELGYIKARQGEDALAVAHYQTEMQLYPESRLFLERLTAQEKRGEG